MAILSSGCAEDDPAKEIIGTWVIVKDVQIGRNEFKENKDAVGIEFEFFSDKTYMVSIRGEKLEPREWVLLDDGRIKMAVMLGTGIGVIKNKQLVVDISGRFPEQLILEKKTAK
jgi:hypothetical protein